MNTSKQELALQVQDAVATLREGSEMLQKIFENPEVIQMGLKFRGVFESKTINEKLMIKCFFDAELPVKFLEEVDNEIKNRKPKCEVCGSTDFRNVDVGHGTVLACNGCFMKFQDKMSKGVQP